MDRPVGVLTDAELSQEIKRLVERLEALRREKRRRLISLDGDIGRHVPRGK